MDLLAEDPFQKYNSSSITDVIVLTPGLEKSRIERSGAPGPALVFGQLTTELSSRITECARVCQARTVCRK
jgi:hypothetical protein